MSMTFAARKLLAKKMQADRDAGMTLKAVAEKHRVSASTVFLNTVAPPQRIAKLEKRNPVTASAPVIHDLFAAVDASLMTMARIEEVSGVSKKAMAAWRYGEHAPDVNNLTAVANVLGLEITLIKREP